MKNIITTYTFDASAKTIDFSGYSGFDIKRLQAILNLTTPGIIYAVGVSGKGYASFAANVLTLQYDTTAMADTDDLQILYLEDTQLDTSALGLETTLQDILAKISSAPATEAKQDAIITLLTLLNGYVDGLEGYVDGLESALSTLNSKDFATQTTLALIKAKTDNLDAAISTLAKSSEMTTLNAKDFATSAKQDSIITQLTAIAGYVDTLETLLTALNGYVDGVEPALATLNGKDFATETTLAAVLAELRDDVFVSSTLWEDPTGPIFYREERVRSQNDGSISTVYTRLSDNTTVVSLPAGCIPVDGSTDRDIQYFRWKANASGTGYTAGDWVANTLIYDTAANGSIISSTWYNLSTSSSISAPTGSHLDDPQASNATAAKQDTGNASLATIASKDFATQTTLAAILAKIIAAPATEAKQDSIITLLTALNGYVDGLEAATGAVADAAASSDTGSFSIISFIKRGLQNWTTLLARIPALGQATMANSTPVAIASNQSAIPVTYSASRGNASVSSATNIFSVDCSGYNGIAVQCTSAGTATITYEQSNDNSTWVACVGTDIGNTGSSAMVSTSTTTGIRLFKLHCRYFRARVSSYTSGTITAYYELTQQTVPEKGVNIGNATLAATQSGTWTVQPGNTANTTAWLVSKRPNSSGSGGLSISRVISAASTNATSAKGSAGNLFCIIATNINAAVRYLKIYNKATAPTVGTDTPVLTIPIPGNSAGAGIVIPFPEGVNFATGIAYAITTGVADNDTGAVAASEIVVQLLYA